MGDPAEPYWSRTRIALWAVVTALVVVQRRQIVFAVERVGVVRAELGRAQRQGAFRMRLSLGESAQVP